MSNIHSGHVFRLLFPPYVHEYIIVIEIAFYYRRNGLSTSSLAYWSRNCWAVIPLNKQFQRNFQNIVVMCSICTLFSLISVCVCVVLYRKFILALASQTFSAFCAVKCDLILATAERWYKLPEQHGESQIE